jgi:competence protein ComEA
MNIEIMGRQILINKMLLICICVILLLILGIVGYFLSREYFPLGNTDVEDIPVVQPAVESQAQPKQEIIPDIKVYVTGCVNKPGIVTLKKGQLIDDAIKAAGGAAQDADLENINLAYKLDENTMLRIKAKGVPQAANTAKSTNPVSKTTSNSKSAKKVTDKKESAPADISALSGVEIITDSLDTVVGEQKQDSKTGGKVNINKASSTELENLPSIGAATAKAIIDYREKNGGFKDIKDIMKISGIKQKTFDKIKDLITI